MGTVREILHVDMDAFYASVEQHDDPSLRGKPVLVGGASRRGVVAAASYEARRFGARSAMPMAEARSKCPNAIVVAPRRERYEEVSAAVFRIFRRFTPLVEGLSLDEAFLDVTASRSLFGDGERIARRIKDAIRAETGLTASAGVAPCKFAAKIASDLEKPDGLVVVPAYAVAEFLAPLPIERMWGIGPKTAPRIRDAGFSTIGDLARADPSRLERLLGSWGREIHLLARGEDSRDVVADAEAKSIGAEETFEHDLRDRASIERRLLDQSSRVALRLLAAGLSARVVVVKLKYADFTLRSRQTALPAPVRDTQSIYAAARELLDRFPAERQGVRLTGVAVADLVEGEPAPTLFPDEKAERHKKLDEVRARVSGKFGEKGLTLAALLEDERANVGFTARLPSARERRGGDGSD
jgi:DNA polymerase-4